ncbi:hypothetical protein ACOME3_010122 [Neoechinorhynchus agilis]
MTHETYMNEIVPYLFIGSRHALENLSDSNTEEIKAVLSYRETDRKTIKGVEHYHIIVQDKIDQNVLQYFEASNAIIHEARRLKRKILVHCSMGISRAPTFAAAYLMWSTGVSLQEALRAIKLRRPCIRPNNSFLRQLKEYSQSLENNSEHKRSTVLESTMSLDDRSQIRRLSGLF